MPHPGMGPTVIAASLVVLIIGIGWLNHSGDTGDPRSSPLARDVARSAGLDVPSPADIPASQPAVPYALGPNGSTPALPTQPTRVVDPATGEMITINLPVIAGVTPTTAPSGTGTSTGTGTGTATTRPRTGTTASTAPPPTSGTTAPPPTEPPSSESTTDTPPTEPTTAPSTSDTITDVTTGLLSTVNDAVQGVVDTLV